MAYPSLGQLGPQNLKEPAGAAFAFHVSCHEMRGSQVQKAKATVLGIRSGAGCLSRVTVLVVRHWGHRLSMRCVMLGMLVPISGPGAPPSNPSEPPRTCSPPPASVGIASRRVIICSLSRRRPRSDLERPGGLFPLPNPPPGAEGFPVGRLLRRCVNSPPRQITGGVPLTSKPSAAVHSQELQLPGSIGGEVPYGGLDAHWHPLPGTTPRASASAQSDWARPAAAVRLIPLE